jgi:hypothetical protein
VQSDYDLKETIAKLIYRMKAAPEDSAAHRLIVRELEGLLVYEMAQPIMEDFGLFMNHRPVAPRTEPGQILPLSPRWPGPAIVPVPRPDQPYAML